MPKSTKIDHSHYDHHHHLGHHRRLIASSSSSSPSISAAAAAAATTTTAIATTSTLIDSIRGITSHLPAPPRKVSFEDGHSDDAASSSSDSETKCAILPLHHHQHYHQQQQQPETSDKLRFLRSGSSSFSQKPRILARHRPSLSLVDLAKSAAIDDCNSKIALSATSKRPHSAPVSPVSTSSSDPERYFGGGGGVVVTSSTPSADLLSPRMEASTTLEPWGYFVDMTLSSECHQQQLRNVPKTIPISARHSSSGTKASTRNRHRRRRKYANPYSKEYHTSSLVRHNRCPLRFLPTGGASSSNRKMRSDGSRFDLRTQLEPISSTGFQFQLIPRKESADQITGDLERLHFR